MTHSTISLGLGLGGGKAATSSGRSAGGGGAYANLLSASLDGTDDYLQLGNGILTALSGTTYSISMWYKLDQEGSFMVPIAAGSASDLSNLVEFYFRSRGSGTVSLEFYAGGATRLIETSPFQSINQWVNGVVTVDTSGTSRLYVNGTETHTSVNVPQVTPTNPVIGCLNGVSNFLDGKIDEVAIFDSQLSASDVTAIYNSGVPGDLSSLSPVGWWRMGDGTGDTDSGSGAPASGDTIGTVVNQGSASSSDATGTNGALYSDDVPYVLPSVTNTLSGSFDGTDDSLDVSSTSDYAFGSSGFSISFWFNGGSTNASSGFGVNIFDMRTSLGGNQPSLWIETKGASSLVKYYASAAYRVSTTATINSGTWYHLAITNDGSTTKIYLDGNSIGTGSDPTNYVAAPLRIGGYHGNQYYYDGLVDEFAIFNSELSASDVTAIYNSGVPADLSSLSPLGWWRIGDGTGDTDSGGGAPASGDTIGTVVDQGSGGNDATGTNGPTYSTDVPT